MNNQKPRAVLGAEVPAKNANNVIFSPDSSHFVLCYNDAVFKFYTISGILVFRKQFEDMDRVVISPGGQYIMLYGQNNIDRGELVFTDNQGKVIWKKNLGSAVSCAAVRNNSNVCKFAVATEDRRVYIIDIGEDRKNFRRWRASGKVDSLVFSYGGEAVVATTSNPFLLEKRSLSGSIVWQEKMPDSIASDVRRSCNSECYLVRTNSRNDEVVYSCLNAQGKSRELFRSEENDRPGMMANPNGLFFCGSYIKKIEHKGDSTYESRISLIDRSGTRKWEKGSLMFQAMPIAVTDSGGVLMIDQNNSLMSASRRGELEKLFQLSSKVKKTVLSPNCKVSACFCSDGIVRLLHIK